MTGKFHPGGKPLVPGEPENLPANGVLLVQAAPAEGCPQPDSGYQS